VHMGGAGRYAASRKHPRKFTDTYRLATPAGGLLKEGRVERCDEQNSATQAPREVRQLSSPLPTTQWTFSDT